MDSFRGPGSGTLGSLRTYGHAHADRSSWRSSPAAAGRPPGERPRRGATAGAPTVAAARLARAGRARSPRRARAAGDRRRRRGLRPRPGLRLLPPRHRRELPRGRHGALVLPPAPGRPHRDLRRAGLLPRRVTALLRDALAGRRPDLPPLPQGRQRRDHRPVRAPRRLDPRLRPHARGPISSRPRPASSTSCRSPGTARPAAGAWRRATTSADHQGVTRRVRRECMFCHNGYPEVRRRHRCALGAPGVPRRAARGHRLPALPRTRGGARPGGAARRRDVAERQALGATIVNPGRLPPLERDNVCMQCHLQPSVAFTGVRRFSTAPTTPSVRASRSPTTSCWSTPRRPTAAATSASRSTTIPTA